MVHFALVHQSSRLLYSKPLFVKTNTFRFTIISQQLIGKRPGQSVTTSYPQTIIIAILESSSFAMRVGSMLTDGTLRTSAEKQNHIRGT